MEISRLEFSHTQTSSHHDGDSHEQNKDMCSPFCICNCCGLQFLSFQPINTYEVPIISTIIKIALPSYKSVLASSFFGSIWQPPQLV
ncbi:hypothetical protein E4635_02330 [Flavobacterium humi]|uniref:Uncharacterized protein n=2 Tax=Flavobacterium humi TaxID=2562683 RepID=A0A4Z0LDH5_9FLAO|nr:hypothetical protein E4635_02330 [Flavobacterium humi]